MAVYGIREVRASERVSERVSRAVRVSTRGWLFIGQSAQLRAIKNATVAHGRCLICMHDACKWTVPNHRVLACKCMQMDGACCPAFMHACMRYIRVCALLCFLACKLAGTRCYLCAKNMDGAQLCVATCYLFLQRKRSEKKARGGARMSWCACERVRSARGPGASALRR